jgi:hypothetical protein
VNLFASMFAQAVLLVGAIGGAASVASLLTVRAVRRKAIGEGRKAEAEGAQVVVSSALVLLVPLQQKVAELTNELELAIDRARNAEAEAAALRRGDLVVADELLAVRRRRERGRGGEPT